MSRLLLLVSLASAIAVWAAKPSEWQDLRDKIRTTLYVPNPLPDLREKGYGQFSPAPDIAVDRVSYVTAYNLRVPALVYHLAAPTVSLHPALIIVNGHGDDKASQYDYWAGILYARAGAVVLTYDPIGEYERNRERQSGTNQHDELLTPQSMALRLTGLMVTDVLQATQYLASRKDVDPKRIAVLGFSLGSFIGSLACAADTSIYGCVLVGGGNLDGPGGYWDTSQPMCQATAYQSLSFLGNRGATILALHAKSGPALIWNGSNDTTVAISVYHDKAFFEKLHAGTVARLGNSKDVFQFGFTPDGGHSPYFLSRPVARWLNDKLQLPNWPKKQLDAIPEKDIAGLATLGDNIPNVPRANLYAVPEAVWMVERDNFIYETWVERAKAASHPF